MALWPPGPWALSGSYFRVGPPGPGWLAPRACWASLVMMPVHPPVLDRGPPRTVPGLGLQHTWKAGRLGRARSKGKVISAGGGGGKSWGSPCQLQLWSPVGTSLHPPPPSPQGWIGPEGGSCVPDAQGRWQDPKATWRGRACRLGTAEPRSARPGPQRARAGACLAGALLTPSSPLSGGPAGLREEPPGGPRAALPLV